jgi:hypothetical protein
MTCQEYVGNFNKKAPEHGPKTVQGQERGTYVMIKYHAEGASVNAFGNIRKPLNLEWRNQTQGQRKDE